MAVEIFPRGKQRSAISYLVTTMGADGLATKGSKASTAMILTWFTRYIPVSAPEGLVDLWMVFNVMNINELQKSECLFVFIFLSHGATQSNAETTETNSQYSDNTRALWRLGNSPFVQPFVYIKENIEVPRYIPFERGIHVTSWFPSHRASNAEKRFHVMTSSYC